MAQPAIVPGQDVTLGEDLRRFFAGAGLRQPVPQQPSEELLSRLADELTARCAGCDWAEGLLGVLSRTLDDYDALLVPPLGLLMGVEHERLAAAAVCALASLVSDSTTEGHGRLAYGISLFCRSWEGLPRCLAAAVARPAVADAADEWHPHSVAAAACFAMAQAIRQHGGRVPPASAGVQGLWLALPRVGAAAAAAGSKLTETESFHLIGAACNFANGLNLEMNWAAHKSRARGMFASAFKVEAACATVNITAAAAAAFRHALEQEAQAHPRCNLLTVSRPYVFVRTILVSGYGHAYRVAIHAQPAPLPPATARTILDVNLQVLRAAAASSVHAEQKADCTELMFEWFNLAAMAMCALPEAEQLAHISAVAALGEALLGQLPAPGSPAAGLPLLVCFHTGLVRAMALFSTSAYTRAAPPTPTLRHFRECAAYLVPLLRWTQKLDDATNARMRDMPPARRVNILTEEGSGVIDNLHGEVFWIIRAGICSMTQQLAAGLAAATGLQQRQAWATAAADAGVLELLAAHMLGNCQGAVFDSAAGTLGALVQIAEAQAALLTAAAAIAAASAPTPHVYAAATAAAAMCCVMAGLAVQLKRVPPVADVRFSGGGICSSQNTSQRLSEASALLAAFAAKEAAVQPGVLLLSQATRQLYTSLEAVPADALSRQPVAAAFSSVCGALAAVAVHGRGCCAEMRTFWRPSSLPASARKSGAVPAAIARVSRALSVGQTTAAQAATTAAPSADAVKAAEAAAAALLAEEEDHQQQAAKRQAKAAKKARQKARKSAVQAVSSDGAVLSGASSSIADEAAVAAGGSGAGAAAAGRADARGASQVESPAVAAAAQLQQARLQDADGEEPPAEAAAGEADWATCPLSKRRMVDPVVAADGITYHREAIQDWLRTKNTSPATGAPLMNKTLVPNYALRSLLSSTAAAT